MYRFLTLLCCLCLYALPARAEDICIEDPNNTLSIKFTYGSWRYTYAYELEDFTYNPETNRYTLSVANVDNQLVRNFHFTATYDLDMPVFMEFSYGFDIGKLPNIFPVHYPKAEALAAYQEGPMPDVLMFGDYPWLDIDPEHDPMFFGTGEVYFEVDMSAILLPLSNNYYLKQGLETKHIDGTPQSDKSIVHSIHQWPSYYGMTDWMCTDSTSEDHLIQGGLIEISCTPGDCSASVSFRVTDWWMPDDINRIFMTQECLCSDYTSHAGLSSMRVAIEQGNLAPKSELIQESECEEITTERI
jgi:hypothetical protein